MKNLGPKITPVREIKRASRKRQKTTRWVFNVFVHISSVTTFFVSFVQMGKEGLTTSRKSIGHCGVLEGEDSDILECKDTFVLVNEVHSRDCFLDNYV